MSFVFLLGLYTLIPFCCNTHYELIFSFIPHIQQITYSHFFVTNFNLCIFIWIRDFFHFFQDLLYFPLFVCVFVFSFPADHLYFYTKCIFYLFYSIILFSFVATFNILSFYEYVIPLIRSLMFLYSVLHLTYSFHFLPFLTISLSSLFLRRFSIFAVSTFMLP